MIVPVTPDYKMTKAVMIDHREAIFHYASLGYRFVTAIPTENVGGHNSLKMDLVFEIDEGEEPDVSAPF